MTYAESIPMGGQGRRGRRYRRGCSMFAGKHRHGRDPFGFGGWGPGRGGPAAFFGGGRRAGRGDIRAAILALLAEQAMHGYQIIRELSRAHGWGVEAEPRLGLSDAAAARGRGARLRAEVRHRPARVRADRRRARAGGGAAVRRLRGSRWPPRPTTSTATCAAWCSRCSARCARWPAAGTPAQLEAAQEVLRRHAPQPVPDPGRGRRLRRRARHAGLIRSAQRDRVRPGRPAVAVRQLDAAGGGAGRRRELDGGDQAGGSRSTILARWRKASRPTYRPAAVLGPREQRDRPARAAAHEQAAGDRLDRVEPRARRRVAGARSRSASSDARRRGLGAARHRPGVAVVEPGVVGVVAGDGEARAARRRAASPSARSRGRGRSRSRSRRCRPRCRRPPAGRRPRPSARRVQ